MHTNDFVIRSALQNQLLEEYRYDNDALILNEFGICQGTARVDMAVVNGTLNGYEIKSDLDNLERLPAQSSYYNKVFDYMEIVVGEKHLQHALDIIPTWWGITIAARKDNSVDLVLFRSGMQNTNTDAYSIVQLLWKDEALNLLCEYGLEKGYRSKNKEIIWRRLADNLPLDQLRFRVRQCLKTRINWRVDLEPREYDG